MDAEEPRYVRPGDEFGDGNVDRMPKWRKPSGSFQLGLFRVTHRKYWPEGSEGKSLRFKFIELERGLVPLSTGIIAEYPEEWVKNCFDWAEEKNRKAGYPVIGLFNLWNLINDVDAKNKFLKKYFGGQAGVEKIWKSKS